MNIAYTIGRSEQRIPPHTTVADTSGLTIRAVLICTRVINTQHNDAINAANPISLTHFGAFHAAMSTPMRKMVSTVIGPEPPMKK